MAIRDLSIVAYRAAAEEAYSTGSKLEGTVFMLDGVIGDTQRFPVTGPMEADEASGTDPVMEQAMADAKPVAHLRPYESFKRVRNTDTFFTNVAYARSVGMATSKGVGRRKDESIIESVKDFASDAYTRPGLTAMHSVTAAGTNTASGEFDLKALATAIATLMDEGVADSIPDVTFVTSWKYFASLGTITEFTSSDYVERGAIGRGRLPDIYGMNVVLIDFAGRKDGYGRLDDGVGYVYARNAIGLAKNPGEKMGIMDWIADRQSWLIGACASFGSTPIQNAGKVEVKVKV